MELVNCRCCGALYPALRPGLCVDCREEDEKQYQAVRSYVRKHPDAPVMEVSQATGVSTAQIYEFVRKGKLIAESPDSDLAVECASCGVRIVAGRFCEVCQTELRGQRKDRRSQLTGRVHLRDVLRRKN